MQGCRARCCFQTSHAQAEKSVSPARRSLRSDHSALTSTQSLEQAKTRFTEASSALPQPRCATEPKALRARPSQAGRAPCRGARFRGSAAHRRGVGFEGWLRGCARLGVLVVWWSAAVQPSAQADAGRVGSFVSCATAWCVRSRGDRSCAA